MVYLQLYTNMIVQRLPHFINGLKCRLHNHGASCAVDALLELFHFGVYLVDYDVRHRDCHDDTLLTKLIVASARREQFGPCCNIRDDVWQHLVSTIPKSYFPPGRRDAEILSAFEALCSIPGTLFNSQHYYHLQCASCPTIASEYFSLGALRTLDQSLNAVHIGDIALIIESSFDQSVRHHLMQKRCRNCSDQMFVLDHQWDLPDYVFLALGLDLQAKNIHNPAPVVAEQIKVHGQAFAPSAAIQMEPGHVFCICRKGDQFAVIDGCMIDVLLYPTFASAVSRRQDLQRTKDLSTQDNGIHILMYHKVKDATPSRPSEVMSQVEVPPPGPSEVAAEVEAPTHLTMTPVFAHSECLPRPSEVMSQVEVPPPGPSEVTAEVEPPSHLTMTPVFPHSPPRTSEVVSQVEVPLPGTSEDWASPPDPFQVMPPVNITASQGSSPTTSSTPKSVCTESTSVHQYSVNVDSSKLFEHTLYVGDSHFPYVYWCQCPYMSTAESFAFLGLKSRIDHRGYKRTICGALGHLKALGPSTFLREKTQRKRYIQVSAIVALLKKKKFCPRPDQGSALLEKLEGVFSCSSPRDQCATSTPRQSTPLVKHAIASQGSSPNLSSPTPAFLQSESPPRPTEVMAAVEAPSTGPSQVVSGLETPPTGPSQIVSGVGTPSTGSSQVVSGVGTPSTGASQVMLGLETLPTGLSGVGTPSTGPYQVMSGVETPSTGPPEVVPGVETPSTGPYQVMSEVETPSTGSYQVMSEFETPSTGPYQVMSEVEAPATGPSKVLSGVEAPPPVAKRSLFKEHSALSSMTTVVSEVQETRGSFRICGSYIPVLHWQEDMYLPLTSCLSALDLPNYLDNRGHPAICRALMQMGCAGKETFILLSDIDEVGNTGRWISKRCLLALLRNDQIFQRKIEQKTVFFRLLKKFKLHDKLPSPGNTVSDSDTNTCSDSASIFSDDSTSSPGNDITVTPISGKVNVNNKMTTYIVESGKVWVEIRMFPFLRQHINKRAFHFIDEALSREGLYPESCFRTTSRRYKRSHGHTKALHTILDHCFSHRKQECLTAKSLLDDIKDAIICNLIEKQACKANTRPVPDSEKLAEFVHEELGSKMDCLKAMSCLVKPVSLSGPSALFLNKEDLLSLLDLASNCPTKKKLVTEAVACYYRKKHMFTAEELLHIEENFSGVRLMDALRKKMPGIMPSLAQERKYRKASRTAFRATILPRKCATGYYIDPRKLLEVFLHKYHFLEDTITLRLWGDGREIGGRHCVVIGMSVISHDLKLHGLSYHDPRDVYPIMMCYEGDSRDNLEENLGVKGFLESFISDLPKNIQVLLCGDHMFLQNILGADEDKLSPTSDEGWNLYSCTLKEHNKVVAKTGLRTDVPQKFDRLQPNSLLPSIPNKHVVFCLLHAMARIVEKLVNLEIEIIHVNANTLGQTNKAPLNKEDLLANLEANINRRDVQQGNFRVHFDKSGKPEPVKFNKDAAMAIISPAPPGKEADYPHVLSNVLFEREAQINMTKAAKKYLDIPDTATDIHLVSLIWESMYQMLSILKSDPDPVLLEGRPEGSVHVQDYKWGYSADQLQSYKFHAERFYQLYCARYKWHNLTPYMCKLVDYALYFMNDLPVPIVRCQAEAGEHANYLHGNIFYSHTTRHGGKYNVDPIVSIFETTWRRLCLDISGKKGEPAEHFAK